MFRTFFFPSLLFFKQIQISFFCPRHITHNSRLLHQSSNDADCESNYPAAYSNTVPSHLLFCWGSNLVKGVPGWTDPPGIKKNILQPPVHPPFQHRQTSFCFHSCRASMQAIRLRKILSALLVMASWHAVKEQPLFKLSEGNRDLGDNEWFVAWHATCNISQILWTYVRSPPDTWCAEMILEEGGKLRQVTNHQAHSGGPIRFLFAAAV